MGFKYFDWQSGLEESQFDIIKIQFSKRGKAIYFMIICK